MTDTLLEQKPISTDTPSDNFRHYFNKKDLDLNLLEGIAIKAICGFVKEGLAKPDSNLPVCKDCDWLWKNVSFN